MVHHQKDTMSIEYVRLRTKSADHPLCIYVVVCVVEINICCLAAHLILLIWYKIPSVFFLCVAHDCMHVCVCVWLTNTTSSNDSNNNNNIQLPKRNDRTIHIVFIATQTLTRVQRFLVLIQHRRLLILFCGWLAGSFIGFWIFG